MYLWYKLRDFYKRYRHSLNLALFITQLSPLIMRMRIVRIAVTALAISGAGLFGIANKEVFIPDAYLPTVNDVPTIGFGSTGGVKMGDKITPEAALERLYYEVEDKYSNAVRKCIIVPLSQGEFDAYVDLSYNIGTGAFCRSTLVKLANQGKYAQACSELHKWVYQKGKVLRGLVKRRAANYKTCTRGH